MDILQDDILIADYVIIGSGPGGAQLAKQLTDDHRYSVILIESGPNYDQDPTVYETTINNITNKMLNVEREKYCQPWFTEPEPTVNNRKLFYVSGKMLGGTSSLNGAQYSRSTVQFHQEFADFTGSDVWAPSPELFEIYRECENYQGTTELESNRGRSGPVNIRQAPEKETHVSRQIADVYSKVLGIPLVDDPNTDTIEHPQPVSVFTRWQLFEKPDGTRTSASRVFISPYVESSPVSPDIFYGKDGRKLVVMCKTTVDTITFEGNRATGVIAFPQFTQDKNQMNRKLQIKANIEVICSAGVNTPLILQRSGIGDEEFLKRMGIPVIFNNPNVGKHHLDGPMVLFQVTGPKGSVPENDPRAMFCGGSFLPDIGTKYQRGYLLEIMPTPQSTEQDNLFNFSKDQDGKSQTIIWDLLQLRSRSEGSIEISSRDPFVAPKIVENILTDPQDVLELKEAIQRYIVTPIDNLIKEYPQDYSYLYPSRDVLVDTTPGGKLEQFLKEGTYNTYHYCGTSRAGKDPSTSVVDPVGKVFGVEQLRIVDASIIPVQPDSTMTALILMISRRIGQVIIGQRQKRDE